MRIILLFVVIATISCKGPDFQPVFECPSGKFSLPASLSAAQNHGFLQAPGGSLFYWLVPAQENPDTAPLVLWLNGGPGSSSLVGMFVENGPYFLNRDMTTYANPYSWHRKANMLYIDQPAGVGFSNTSQAQGPPRNEDELSTRLFAALTDFINRAHTEFKNRDLFIFGESFAGIYIPWLTSKILIEKKLKLKGIGIGDGVIDNPTNWKWQDEFALDNGLILPEQRDYIESTMWPKCEAELADAQATGADNLPETCVAINRYIRDVATNINYYNTSNFGSYDFRALECFLNNGSVRASLGVESQGRWSLGNDDVLNARAVDAIYPTVPLLKSALSNGVRVLIYHGEKDLLINHVGAEAWLKSEFGMETLRNWKIGDRLVGKTQKVGELEYRLFYNAGHLVPLDQPDVALAMFEEFLSR